MLQDASSIRALADFPWLLSPAAAMFLVVLGLNLMLQGRPDHLHPDSALRASSRSRRSASREGGQSYGGSPQL
jgi:hypothetical protein